VRLSNYTESVNQYLSSSKILTLNQECQFKKRLIIDFIKYLLTFIDFSV